MGIAPALAKDTIGVRPADKAEIASTAKPEALVSWVQDKVRHGYEVNTQPHEALLQKGKHKAEAPSQKHKLECRLNEGKCKSIWRLQEVLQQDKMRACLRHHCKTMSASMHTSRHLRCCHKKASMTSRSC